MNFADVRVRQQSCALFRPTFAVPAPVETRAWLHPPSAAQRASRLAWQIAQAISILTFKQERIHCDPSKKRTFRRSSPTTISGVYCTTSLPPCSVQQMQRTFALAFARTRRIDPVVVPSMTLTPTRSRKKKTNPQVGLLRGRLKPSCTQFNCRAPRHTGTSVSIPHRHTQKSSHMGDSFTWTSRSRGD